MDLIKTIFIINHIYIYIYIAIANCKQHRAGYSIWSILRVSLS